MASNRRARDPVELHSRQRSPASPYAGRLAVAQHAYNHQSLRGLISIGEETQSCHSQTMQHCVFIMKSKETGHRSFCIMVRPEAAVSGAIWALWTGCGTTIR